MMSIALFVRNNLLALCLGGLGLLLPGASLAACDSQAPRANAVTPSAARAAVARGALLLDVRSPGEFAGGHLDGAVNIPIEQLGQRKGEIETGREVVVYCRSGRRSAMAVPLLTEAGHKMIDIGTMGAW